MEGEGKETDFLPPFPQELLSKFKPFRTTYEIHTIHVNKGKMQECTAEEWDCPFWKLLAVMSAQLYHSTPFVKEWVEKVLSTPIFQWST